MEMSLLQCPFRGHIINMAARDGCQENTGWGSGLGSIFFFRECCFRVTVTFGLTLTLNQPLFFKKKGTPRPWPHPHPAFY